MGEGRLAQCAKANVFLWNRARVNRHSLIKTNNYRGFTSAYHCRVENSLFREHISLHFTFAYCSFFFFCYGQGISNLSTGVFIPIFQCPFLSDYAWENLLNTDNVYFICSLFSDPGSLYLALGCPGTHSRAGWCSAHRDLADSSSQVLGLKACTTTAQQRTDILRPGVGVVFFVLLQSINQLQSVMWECSKVRKDRDSASLISPSLPLKQSLI